MDYEKKYNEALNRAREEYKTHESFNGFRVMLLNIFPELEESEDEKIRKELITHCRNIRGVTLEKAERIVKWLAWLEKQESVGEIVERCKVSWYNEGKIQGKIEGLSDDEKYQQGWHDALEKQGEQKQDPCEHCKDKYLNCHNFPCIDKRTFEQGKTALEAVKEERDTLMKAISDAGYVWDSEKKELFCWKWRE